MAISITGAADPDDVDRVKRGLSLGARASLLVAVFLAVGIGVTAGVGLWRSLAGLAGELARSSASRARWAAAAFGGMQAPSAANVAHALDVTVDDLLRAEAASALFLVQAAEEAGHGRPYIEDALRQIVARSPVARVDVAGPSPDSPAYSTAPEPPAWDALDPAFRGLVPARFPVMTAAVPAVERDGVLVKTAASSADGFDALVRFEYLLDTAETARVYGADGDRSARDAAGAHAQAAARLLAHALDLAAEAGWPAGRTVRRLDAVVAGTALVRIAVYDSAGVALRAASAPGVGPEPDAAGAAAFAERLTGPSGGAETLPGRSGAGGLWTARAAAARPGSETVVAAELLTYSGAGSLVDRAWQFEADRLASASGVLGVWLARPAAGGLELAAAAPRPGGAGASDADAWGRWSDDLGAQARSALCTPDPVTRVAVRLVRPADARVFTAASVSPCVLPVLDPEDAPPPGAGAAAVSPVVVLEHDAAGAASAMLEAAVWQSGSALFLILVLAGAAVAVARRTVTDPVEAVAEAAGFLRGGVQPPGELMEAYSARGDEIGGLVRHFDGMAQEVLARHGDMERLVKERTKSLEAAHAVDRARQERLQADVRAAEQVQNALLPPEAASFGSYDLRCRVTAARSLSGDFITVRPLPGGRAFAAVCDVSGKGVGAALFMAVAQTVLSGAAGRSDDPGTVITDANRRLCERNPLAMFVTAAAFVVEPGETSVRYVCAGHEPPLLVRARGGARKAPLTENFPLGIDPAFPYESGSIELAPGDTLAAYTDGLTDGVNAAGEEFGEAGVRRFFESLPPGSDPDGILSMLWEAADAFSAGQPVVDDRTVLLIHRRPPEYREDAAAAGGARTAVLGL